jgi:RNA polymerase sigma-B factor
MAAAASATPEQVLEALESSAAYSTVSLSERSDPDDESQAPMDVLGEEDEAFDRSETRMTLATGIRRLHGRERAILHLRFFEGLTQSEIADRVGISQMHVSRLIRDSLTRIRRELQRAGGRRPS